MLMKIYFTVTAVMSAAAFFAYGLDKHMAKKRKRRISEAALLTLSFFGGALGALVGMYVFRHKTRKPKFRIAVPAMLILWAALGLFIGRIF